MKYDLSKIMKRAWEIKREDSKNIFGICLEMAWEEAKKAASKKVAVIKDWFLNKKFGSEASHFSNSIEIEKESEKAVFGKVGCSYGTSVSYMEIWCPKSCLC